VPGDEPRRAYAVSDLDRLERIPLGEAAWRPVRRNLEVTGFGVNAYTAARAGTEVIEPHDETSAGAGGHEELYVVLSGAAEFEVDGERIDAPEGSLIRVDVGVERSAKATLDDTTVLVLGGPPGTALPVSPFEYWYAAQGPYALGDYERAIEVASEGLSDYPRHPSLHYQLACFNALAGRSDAALDHLQTAVAGNPEIASWAPEDSDLDSIRSDSRFPEG
jgi:mannose-6-phosphate isomerase-like protein (cupin superfamily)